MATKDDLTPEGKKIMAEIAKLAKKPFVKCGFPQQQGDKPKTKFSDEHKPEPGEKTSPKLKVGEIAVIHEFGSSDRSIPRRPLLRSTFDRMKGFYSKMTEAQRKKVMGGKMPVEKALGLTGQKMAADAKMTIKNRIPPPLKPATLKRKTNKKGQTADVPLIWKGQMVNSITYKVMMQGEKGK